MDVITGDVVSLMIGDLVLCTGSFKVGGRTVGSFARKLLLDEKRPNLIVTFARPRDSTAMVDADSDAVYLSAHDAKWANHFKHLKSKCICFRYLL